MKGVKNSFVSRFFNVLLNTNVVDSPNTSGSTSSLLLAVAAVWAKCIWCLQLSFKYAGSARNPRQADKAAIKHAWGWDDTSVFCDFFANSWTRGRENMENKIKFINILMVIWSRSKKVNLQWSFIIYFNKTKCTTLPR